MFISLAKGCGLGLYIFIDLVYVIGSQDFYKPTIQALNSGQPPQVSTIYIGLAYLCMMIGWLSFAVPKVEELQAVGRSANFSALVAGFLYGVTVYGVFNFTLGVMAGPWGLVTILRDLSWGIVSSIVSLRLYLLIKGYVPG